MKNAKGNQNQTTYSQRRAKQLMQRSQKIAKMFNINNFYDNNHINVDKLRQKINEAKKKLLQDRQRDKQKDLQKLKEIQREKQRQRQKERVKSKSRDKQLSSSHLIRNKSIVKTEHDIGQYKNMPLAQLKTKRFLSRGTQHRSRVAKNERMARIATQLSDYQVDRKNSLEHNSRVKMVNYQTLSRFKSAVNPHESNYMRYQSIDTPTGKNTRSVSSFQIQNRKIILKQQEQLKSFEMKISMLWQLYEIIVQLMQQASKSPIVNQKLVINYINQVNSQKFQFVHEIYELFTDIRVQRTIRLCRILQNFAIFQMCLNSIPKKKVGSTQIINYLGYSSSSVIFLIRIMLLTHQAQNGFSQHIEGIIESIVRFQVNSYKSQLRNVKQVLRRLEHNNQIISMIKTRCGKKHGKYCEQFITKMIKSVQKFKTPFYECANNIFQFFAFYLHYEDISENLPLISTPPSPFLSLAYSKTIIIDPWSVLAYKKNNKLVIRAHAGKFLAQISDNCNIIFWTQFMPKDADVLINIFPVKDNVYWLYRYHCRKQKQTLVKMIDLVGSITENTIIIDSDSDHFIYNQDIGIVMPWKGEKRDTKLLNLSDIVQDIISDATKNKTTLKEQLQKYKPEIEQLNMKKVFSSKQVKYRGK